MLYVDHIRKWLETDGGVLVRPTFLDPAGKPSLTLEERPVSDLLIKKAAIAYWTPGGERPHLFRIQGAEFDMDEWNFMTEDGVLRITVSPIWLDEHRDELVQHKEHDGLGEENRAHLQEVFNEM